MTCNSRYDRCSVWLNMMLQLSSTTSISFMSLPSFSDEEYTSAPDARESINSAKRDLSRLGSYNRLSRQKSSQRHLDETYFSNLLKIVLERISNAGHPEPSESFFQHLLLFYRLRRFCL